MARVTTRAPKSMHGAPLKNNHFDFSDYLVIPQPICNSFTPKRTKFQTRTCSILYFSYVTLLYYLVKCKTSSYGAVCMKLQKEWYIEERRKQ